MRRLLGALLRCGGTIAGAVAVLVLSPATTASAHVHLATATPAPDATVSEPVPAVRVEFDGALAADGDHAIGLFAPDGERLELGDITMVADNAVEAALTGELPVPGAYRVQWLVIGGDGHTITGEYTFRYDGPVAAAAPATPEPSPEASPSASPSPSPSPSSEPATLPSAAPISAEVPSDDEGSSTPLLIGVGVVAVVAAGAFAAARRRRSR